MGDIIFQQEMENLKLIPVAGENNENLNQNKSQTTATKRNVGKLAPTQEQGPTKKGYPVITAPPVAEPAAKPVTKPKLTEAETKALKHYQLMEEAMVGLVSAEEFQQRLSEIHGRDKVGTLVNFVGGLYDVHDTAVKHVQSRKGESMPTEAIKVVPSSGLSTTRKTLYTLFYLIEQNAVAQGEVYHNFIIFLDMPKPDPGESPNTHSRLAAFSREFNDSREMNQNNPPDAATLAVIEQVASPAAALDAEKTSKAVMMHTVDNFFVYAEYASDLDHIINSLNNDVVLQKHFSAYQKSNVYLVGTNEGKMNTFLEDIETFAAAHKDIALSKEKDVGVPVCIRMSNAYMMHNHPTTPVVSKINFHKIIFESGK
jgi:hypothetical protein